MDIVDHLRLVVAPHAQRFIDGHFGNNAPRPQISIPASENEDSDLILSRGIKSAADEIERLRAVLRVNLLRYVPGVSHAEIDNLLERDHTKQQDSPVELPGGVGHI